MIGLLRYGYERNQLPAVEVITAIRTHLEDSVKVERSPWKLLT